MSRSIARPDDSVNQTGQGTKDISPDALPSISADAGRSGENNHHLVETAEFGREEYRHAIASATQTELTT